MIVLKATRKNGWHSEQVYFSELKDGNQVFYLVDPLSVEKPAFAQPCYPATHPQEPDTIVWVMAEAWLVDRLGRLPQLKRFKPEPGDRPNATVANLINSKGSDWF